MLLCLLVFSSILYNLSLILRAFNESFKNEVRFRRTQSSSANFCLIYCASGPGKIKIQWTVIYHPVPFPNARLFLVGNDFIFFVESF